MGSAGNAPVVASGLFEDTGFTDRQPDHFPEIGLPAVAAQDETQPSPADMQQAKAGLE